MKRRLLNLLTLVSVMLIAGISSAWAQGSNSFDLTKFDAAHPVIFSKDDVTLQFNKSSDISPASNERGIRWQQSIDFTITVPEGNHVTEVILTSNKNGNFDVAADKVMPIVISTANDDGTKGEYIEDGPTLSAKADTYTWTNANGITNNSINFSFTGSGDAYIKIIDVKYEANPQTEQPAEAVPAAGVMKLPRNGSSYTNNGTEGDITENKTLSLDGEFSVTISPKESGNTNNRFWTYDGGPQLRVYSGTITISAADGKKLTKIVFDETNNGTMTADCGTYENKTWTGDAETVVFTVSKQCRINSITVGEEQEEEGVVAESIAALKALEPGTEAKLTLSNVIVTALSKGMMGSTYYMEDATGGIAFDATIAELLNAEGVALNGYIYVKVMKTDNEGSYSLTATENTNADGFTQTETTVSANPVTITELNDNMAKYIGMYVKLENVTLNIDEGADDVGTLTDADGNSVSIGDQYNTFGAYGSLPSGYKTFKSISGFITPYIGRPDFHPYGEFEADAESNQPVEVASIAEMKALPNGTSVKLTLTDAKVTVVAQGHISQIVIIEDATAAVQVATSDGFGDFAEPTILGSMFYEVGETVNGFIYCTYRDENGMRCIYDNENTMKSQPQISEEPVAPVPTDATVARLSDMAYDMRYVKVSDARIELNEDESSANLVQGEDKIAINDMFQKVTNPNINVESVTGIMMPQANEVDDDYNVISYIYTFVPLEIVEATAPSYVEVENIAGLREVENGTEVKLTLTDAKVTIVSGGGMMPGAQTVIIEDASGAIMVQADGWDDDYLGNLFTTVGQVANGYVICTYVNEFGTRAIANSEHSAESDVTISDEPAVVTPGTVNVSSLSSTANEMKYLRVYNAKIAIDPEEGPYLSQGNSKIMISPMAMGMIYQNAEVDEEGNPIIPEVYNHVDGYSVIAYSEEDENGTVVNTFMFNPTAIIPANFKEYTETTVFLPTDESLATANEEAWLASTGAMVTNKKGNIDPATGESITAKAIPGVYTKGDNVGKMFITYATGVSEITAYVISTGNSERTMYATATPVGSDKAVVASASTPQNETAVVTLAGLDPTKQYVVEYSSWEGAAPENNAKPTTSGSDMAITGVKFVGTPGGTPDAITEIISEVNFLNAPVYSVNGVKVRNAGESLDGLAKGLYIIGGKKVVVK